jgi:VanZ family protein
MKTTVSLFNSWLLKPYLAIICTVSVAYLCFMPSVNIPDLTSDKTAHFISFGTMAFLWMWYFRKAVWVWVSLFFFGYFIEFVQLNLPESFHRGFDHFDALADAVGAFIGVLLYFSIQYILKKAALL